MGNSGHTSSVDDLPADYISLHDRCKKLMQDTEGFIYPGLTPERLEGAYIERHRWLALLDYVEANFPGNSLLGYKWLRQAGEGGSRI